MAAVGEATKTPRWRRRLLWALPIGLVLFIGLLVVLLLLLPVIVTPERVRSEAVTALTDLLGAPVQIERLDYHPLTGAELTHLVVGPPEGFTEDVLRVERIRVGYGLGEILSRHVTVKEVAVVGPVLTIETREGRRNIDALLSSTGGEEAPPKEAAEPTEPGPLLPIDLSLERLAVGPATVRLVGEGPNVELSQAEIRLFGEAGRERLDMDLQVKLEPDDADNLTLTLDAAGEPVSLKSRVPVSLRVKIDGATARGLALEEVAVSFEASAGLDASWGERGLPGTRVAFDLKAAVSPGKDTARVEGMRVRFDDADLLSLSAVVDGLSAAVRDLGGAPLSTALTGAVGLVDRDRPGRLELVLERLDLPLERLAPWARLVRPDLAATGRVTVAPFRIAGTTGELSSGRPSAFELKLGLEDVGAALAAESVSLGRLSGTLTGGRREDRYALDGALHASEIRQGANRIEALDVGLSAGAERLAYPSTGATKARVEVGVAGVAAPSARLNRATAEVSLQGRDPLDEGRGDAPIQVDANVTADRTRVTQTGTSAISVAGLRLAVAASVDRLLQTARAPIGAKVDLSVRRANVGAGPSVRRLSASLDASLDDPRAGPFDAQGKLRLRAASASAASAKLSRVDVRLGLRAGRVGPQRIPGFPGRVPSMLPRSVGIDLDVGVPDIRIQDRSVGTVRTGLSLKTALQTNLVEATADLRRLELEMEDVLAIRAKGRARRIYARSPWIDGSATIGPVDLEKLVAKVPRRMLAAASDLTAAGKLKLEVRGKGPVPTSFDEASLVKHPISGRFDLTLEGVGAESRKQAVLLEGLGGTISGELGGGLVATDTKLDIGKIAQGAPKARSEIERLTVRNQVRFQGDVWSVSSRIRARKVRSALSGESEVEEARIVLDASYPRRGDLALQRLEVHAPGNGVELSAAGRLARRTFGVLRPSLSVNARLDLDRLRRLLPAMSGGRGKAALSLKVSSKGERAVDVAGRLEMDRFSWEVPEVLTVLGASGRIPVSQRLVLPAPAPDSEVATASGLLGDDFEARLFELIDHLERAKAVLDTTDILVEAPRTADYQALRPYYAETGARMTIEGIVYKEHALEDVTLEGLWRSGVLRIDRFACRVWEGDVLGDLAVQVTPDRDVRVRLRGTITELNVDVPYAIAKGIDPVTDPSDKEDFRVSGQMDVELALKQRAVNARIDLVKLSLPLVRRAFGALLLEDSPAVSALEIAQYAGVRPESGRIWVSNSLLNVSFDWERLWLHVSADQESVGGKVFDTILFPFRPLLIPTLGGYVINTVNNAVRNFSISAVLEQVLEENRLEERLRPMEGRVIAADRARDKSGAAGHATSR